MVESRRLYCAQCAYPKSTCVCSCVMPFASRVKVDIVQHPKEVHAAKNTARLCKLCMPDINLWMGESEKDLEPLKQSLLADLAHILVLYPSREARDIDQLQPGVPGAENIRIVLIDGTWKKAYKIWQLNTWLHDFDTVKLSGRASTYSIRKSPSPNALSTLEALAHSLKMLDPLAPVQTLFDTFEAMQLPYKRFGRGGE